jgi:hypothetical protein
LIAFLNKFIAGDPISKCIDAANTSFTTANKDSDDRFVSRAEKHR